MRHKIRGKIWSLEYVRRLPMGARGSCDAPTKHAKKIKIKQSLKGILKLDTIIHECLHAGLWDLDEEAVEELAADLARVIWKEMNLGN